MLTKEQGREDVESLVNTFKTNEAEYTRPGSVYNETLLRVDFLNPFFQALGWDVNNGYGNPQNLREVVHEDAIRFESAIRDKYPDYSFRLSGKRKFFVEAKKPSALILTNKDYVFQTRRYGWSANLPISVLTNFEWLLIYDCRVRPDAEDDCRTSLLKSYHYTEYVERYDEIYDQLSRSAVYSGRFDEQFTEISPLNARPFDEYFLQQIEGWRRLLANDFAHHNTDLDHDTLNFLVQRLINRIVFLRVCEDRGTEAFQRLLSVKSYEELKALFLAADRRYNSGLFDFVEDALSLDVQVGSEALVSVFRELYYPASPYTFAVVETAVISEIYELFLGSEILLNDDGSIQIVQKPEVVDSNGVVPTPRYIVEEIVERTLEPLVRGKPPQEMSALCIIDISCGSGVFLVAAYEYLMNCHLEWYLTDGVTKHRDKLIEISEDAWQLSLPTRRKILLSSVFGVDIDPQAVEVNVLRMRWMRWKRVKRVSRGQRDE